MRTPAPFARRGRLLGLGVCALTLVTVACGPGQANQAPGTSTDASPPVLATSTAEDLVQPSTSAPQQWQALQLGGDVVAWLPVGESWTLTEQGRTEAGGTFVRINEADTALTVVAQSLKTPGEVSASALCASGLQSALISAGVDAVPQPVGDPLPETSDLVDRFRCQAQSPDSAGLNYRFDVAIRTTDRLSYTQLVSAPASVGDQEQAAHAQELTELMLGRTVAGLE